MKSDDAPRESSWSSPAVRGEVAIIGMAATYPKARNVAAFWQNIVNGVDAIDEVSPERWDPAVFYDPNPSTEDRVYCKRGGYLDNSFAFNPLRYGTMPRAVEGAEPDQFLVLRAVHEALDDAGYLQRSLDARRCAFILGRGNYLGAGLTGLLQRGIMAEQTLQILRALHPEYSAQQLAEIKAAMRANVPTFGAETAPGLIPNISTGRAANRLDLMGPTFTVDAACASSLIATDLGVHGLLTGQHDLVLVGGVHIFSDVPFLQVFAAMGALSHSSVIRPFDQHCDGTMAGEGVGILVLKRLPDAQRDGDRIYAVIKGVGTSSDGRAKSVTAPRVEGEELALRRAYAMADVDPTTVGLIEAHGTGTPIGDATEVEALRRVLGPRGSGPRRCALGAVKSMIGHTMPAAGAAGLIKTALALYHRVLPPTLHCEKPLAAIDDADSPLYVNACTRPWVHGRSARPRRAGVNAFGFGGVNAHVVLEEYTGPRRTAVAVPGAPGASTLLEAGGPLLHAEWRSELVVLEADSRAALLARCENLRTYLAAAEGVRLAEVAATCNCELPGASVRLALVAGDLADLQSKLDRAAERLRDPACRRIQDSKGIYYLSETELRDGKVALLFPGEGAQYPNMLADLCLHFPHLRARFDAADRAVTDTDRDPPSVDLFPPPLTPAAEQTAAEARLWQIERAVEAVLTADGALFELLQRLQLNPDMIVGHSGGEWIASVAAGLFDVDEFIASLPRLDRMYRDLAADATIPPMAMLAVGAGRETVERLAREWNHPIHIANDNCPHQVVVVTAPDQAAAFADHLRRRQVVVEQLPYDRGYHTPAFTYICEPLRAYFSSLTLSPAKTTLYSCTTAERYPARLDAVVDLLAHTFARPLLFRQTIEKMYADGARVFVEVGPRANLTAFTGDILRHRPHLAIAMNHHRRCGLTSLQHALAVLAALHVPLNLNHLYEHRTVRRLSWDAGRDRLVPEEQQPGTTRVSLCYPKLQLRPEFRPDPATAPVGVTPAPKGSSDGYDYPQPPAASAIRSASPPPPVAFSPAAPEKALPASPPGARAPRGSANVLLSHLQVMEQALSAHEQIMTAYLSGNRPAGRTASLSPAEPLMRLPAAAFPAETALRLTETASALAQPTPVLASSPPPSALAADAPAVSASASAPAAKSLEGLIIDLVSERTGYPPETLNLDLDLEADLGIDSIKRIEILGAVQRLGVLGAGANGAATLDMEAVSRLKTLRAVIECLRPLANTSALPNVAGDTAPPSAALSAAPLAPRSDPADTVPDAGSIPFSGEIVAHTPGQSLTVRRKVTLENDLYLHDHHFDPQISDYDLDRESLCVVPMTITIEMMAEAATLLMPHHRLVGLSGAQIDKWIEVERHAAPPTLELVAERTAKDGEVSVRVHSLANGSNTAPAPVVARADFLFAEGFPPPPPPESFTPRNPRRPSHTAEQMYAEHHMFHGPRFQGVTSLDLIGDDGLIAQLTILPTANLLHGRPQPSFELDPFLLDAAGQLVGYWPVEGLSEGYVLFPIRIQELTRYGEQPPVGTRITCHLRVRHIAHRELHADLDLIMPDGQLWLRLHGWQDWRFHWPRDFYDFWRLPNQGMAGAELRLPLPTGGEDIQCRRMISEGELRSELWRKLWAYLICSRRELAQFRALSSEPRRVEWLAGRSAAKDAVRCWIKRRFGREIYPADIEIVPDERGRPTVAGPCRQAVSAMPQVSIAHKGVIGVGAASQRPVGVDLEHIEPRDDAFLAAAFSGEERRLLAAASGAPADEWTARAWAAKEAAGKAAGVGLAGAPARVIIERMEADRAVFWLRVAATLENEEASPGPRLFEATTQCDGEYVIALAVERNHDGAGV